MMITKEFIELEYIKLNKNCSQIARDLKVTPKTVQNYVRKYGFEVRPKSGPELSSLIGNIYGSYTVIAYIGKGSGYKHKWLCRCKCGRENSINGQSLTQLKTHSCGKCEFSKAFTGKGKLSGTYFKSLKRRAIRDQLEFTIDVNYLWNLFQFQNERCALSGIRLELVHSYSRNCKQQTASVDRIDSNKGYIQGNVQWVHKILNELKSNTPNDEFIKWCKLVAKNN